MTTSLLVLNTALIFAIGFLQDVLSAYYLRLVTEQRFFLATCISFIHNILGWAIWLWFMSKFQSAHMNGVEIVIYSIGSAFGTYMGLKKPYSSQPPPISPPPPPTNNMQQPAIQA